PAGNYRFQHSFIAATASPTLSCIVNATPCASNEMQDMTTDTSQSQNHANALERKKAADAAQRERLSALDIALECKKSAEVDRRVRQQEGRDLSSPASLAAFLAENPPLADFMEGLNKCYRTGLRWADEPDGLPLIYFGRTPHVNLPRAREWLISRARR